jgi:hypothetical protein
MKTMTYGASERNFLGLVVFALMSVGDDAVKIKKTGLLMALGVALLLASAATPKGNAQVAIGVSVGAPVYVHPWRPYRYGYVAPYVVARPYVYAPAPVYPRVYVAPAPVYYRHWYPRRYYARRDFDRYRR